MLFLLLFPVLLTPFSCQLTRTYNVEFTLLDSSDGTAYIQIYGSNDLWTNSQPFSPITPGFSNMNSKGYFNNIPNVGNPQKIRITTFSETEFEVSYLNVDGKTWNGGICISAVTECVYNSRRRLGGTQHLCGYAEWTVGTGLTLTLGDNVQSNLQCEVSGVKYFYVCKTIWCVLYTIDSLQH